jgi:hypothetical protein
MRFNLDNYETVEQRLAKFWEQCPNGRVLTEMVHYDENRVVFRAALYRDMNDAVPVSTGFAEELRDASPVNRTSHVENCETSSIGRACSNWTLSAKASPRPSREEMSKVARQQETKPQVGPDMLTKFREACTKKNINPDEVAKQAGVDLGSLVDADHAKLRDAFKAMTATPADKTEAAQTQVSTFIDQVYSAFPTAKVEDVPQIKDPDAPATQAQVGKIRAMLSGKGAASYTDKLEKVRDFLNNPDLKKIEHITKGDANKVIFMIEEMK